MGKGETKKDGGSKEYPNLKNSRWIQRKQHEDIISFEGQKTSM